MPPKKRLSSSGGYRVIDADGHVSERHGIDWKAALPARYKGLAPVHTEEYYGMRRLLIEGQMVPRPFGAAPGHQGNYNPPSWAGHPTNGLWDPKARLKDMDLDDIDVAVLFGAIVGVHVSGLRNAGLAAALARVYNDWVAEYCKASPRRLKAVASVPLQDVAAAKRELRRAVTRLEAVGAAVPPNVGGKNLDHPDFAPFLAEAEALGAPILVHSGSGVPGIDFAGADRFVNFFHSHMCSHTFEQMMALMTVVCAGLPERLPGLRFAFLEAGVGWLAYWTERMDHHYKTLDFLVKNRRPPSEYIREGRQLFIACEPEESMLPATVGAVGDECIVYASDYLHWDADFPGTVAAIKNNRGLSEASKRKVLGENAARLYGLA